MTNTRKAISLKEKIDIIKNIKSGIGKSESARRKNMAKTPVSTIWCKSKSSKQANRNRRELRKLEILYVQMWIKLVYDGLRREEPKIFL
ncbi:unnamed protein product [Acanthoscelides obtectus]|uniref:HTH psq-type domain-containing protein n=1 Tax=Acanthoscelides obtectus TaxID=200917 RepID=A0A9P0LK45_ACAOB|nr:unnamed protein product [Acanthoscelides obtectus]CAK1621362.1 hypothetical protein AOBTE_LOCUS915 [Acanthoscelides obtectus]